MEPKIKSMRKGQKFFIIEMATLLAFGIVLLFRLTSYKSAILLGGKLMLSILVEKGRPYSPLVIIAIGLHIIRVILGIESWIYFIFELSVYLLSTYLSLIIRFFQIPNRYGLHQQKFDDETVDVGFSSQPFGKTTVSIYYPTKEKTNKDATWITKKQDFKTLYQAFYIDPVTKRIFSFWLFKFCVSYLWTYTIGVHTGARLEPREKYKVIIFSHGLGGHSRGNNSYTNWWARRGYIVISVQHDHDAPCLDYRLQQDVDKRCDWLYVRRHWQITKRKQQIVKVFKGIQAGELDSLFGDKIQVQSIMFAGHSFGGSSILQAGASITNQPLYQKVSKFLSLDPWLFPLSKQTYKNFQRPILFITSQRFVKVNPAFYQLHQKNQTFLQLNPLMSKIYIRQLQHLHPSDMIFTFGTIFVLTDSIRNFGKRMLYVNTLVYMIRLFQQNKTGEQIIQLAQKQIKLKFPEDKEYLQMDYRRKWAD